METENKKKSVIERTEAKGAVAFGTGAIVFLICQGCLIVCMDLRTMKIHISGMKRNCVEGYLWRVGRTVCSCRKKQMHRSRVDGSESIKVTFEGD